MSGYIVWYDEHVFECVLKTQIKCVLLWRENVKSGVSSESNKTNIPVKKQQQSQSQQHDLDSIPPCKPSSSDVTYIITVGTWWRQHAGTAGLSLGKASVETRARGRAPNRLECCSFFFTSVAILYLTATRWSSRRIASVTTTISTTALTISYYNFDCYHK